MVWQKKAEKLRNIFSKSALAGIVILFLISTIIFLSGYYYSKVNLQKTKLQSKILGLVDIKEGAPRDFEQEVVKSYFGRVKEINNNYLIIEAKYIRDKKIILSDLKANLTDSTLFFKKDLYKLYKYGPSNYQKAFSAANKKEIKKDMLVFVYSNENIKYKNEFPASRIEIVYKSQEY